LKGEWSFQISTNLLGDKTTNLVTELDIFIDARAEKGIELFDRLG
jgi:hypothetical protein